MPRVSGRTEDVVMNNPNEAMSRLVKTIEALPEGEREVYRARYVQEEGRDATCVRLGIDGEEYDRRMKSVMRALRRGTGPGPSVQTKH